MYCNHFLKYIPLSFQLNTISRIEKRFYNHSSNMQFQITEKKLYLSNACMSVRSFSALSNPEMSRRRGLWPHTGHSGFVFTVFDGSGYNKKFIFIANKLPRLSLSTPLWMRVRCTVWTTQNNNNKNKKNEKQGSRIS